MQATSPTTLRLASLNDATAIAVLSRDLIEVGLTWLWTPDRVTRHLRQDDIQALVAHRALDVVGFALTRFGETRAHVMLFAVSPEHQRSGVGRRLLEWVVESARTAGITHVDLELRETNLGAHGFYLNQGFITQNRTAGYYRDGEAALRMTRRVSLLLLEEKKP